MNLTTMPIIKDFLDEDDILRFTITNIDVSFVNAIRRTILSDINVCCIEFDSNGVDNKSIDITVNTGRLHNEILKHRLSCIPVYVKEDNIMSQSVMEKFCQENILEIDCHNDSDVSVFVTTKDFRVKNLSTGKYLDNTTIFPPNQITNDYIDFSRLRPKISDTIPGESLKLTAKFSISNASKNSAHNVVSLCSYSNTLDEKAIKTKWSVMETDLKSSNLSEEAILFEKTNFRHLDANRCFMANSFDFQIQSICVLTNREIVTLSIYHLLNRFQSFLELLDTNQVTTLVSESTIPFSFDVQLYDEDYTFGKILEYLLYHHFYLSMTLSYCGFKKFHPHDTKSVIRVAFPSLPSPSLLDEILRECCALAVSTLQSVMKQVV